MSDHDPAGPDEHPRADRAPDAGSGPSVAGGPGNSDVPAPPPPAPPMPPASVTGTEQVRRRTIWSWLSHRRTGWIVAAALALVVIGLSIAVALPSSATATSPVAGSPAGGPAAGGGGSNARSGPAAGGAAGTVSSESASTFMLTTAAGQTVTVDETSGTTYQNETGPASAGAVTAGTDVLVLGTVNGTTITATQVLVQPAGSDGSAASAAAGVVPFQRGTPAPSRQVGRIPANYTEGSGTIVSGPAANAATQAALAAYPGGVVDRVVQLSSGEYEVHYIGVNWPHHIFVEQDFTVVGAE